MFPEATAIVTEDARQSLWLTKRTVNEVSECTLGQSMRQSLFQPV